MVLADLDKSVFILSIKMMNRHKALLLFDVLNRFKELCIATFIAITVNPTHKRPVLVII